MRPFLSANFRDPILNRSSSGSNSKKLFIFLTCLFMLLVGSYLYSTVFGQRAQGNLLPTAQWKASRQGNEDTSTTIDICGPVPKNIADQYSDIVSYKLRTPDLAIDAIIEVDKRKQQENMEMKGGGGRRRSSAMAVSDQKVNLVSLHHQVGGKGEYKDDHVKKTNWSHVRDGAHQEVFNRKLHDMAVVLCQRNRPPYKTAIPGGYVEVGEWVEDTVFREALEETSLQLSSIELFTVFSNPKRDKRRHTVSAVYIANPKYKSSSSSHDDPFLSPSASPHFGVNLQQQLKAADDAKECKFYSWYELRKDFLMYDSLQQKSAGSSEEAQLRGGGNPHLMLDFAFDHRDLMRTYLQYRGVI